MDIRRSRKCLKIVPAFVLAVFIASVSFADAFTPSYITYDTTYEKILQLYLKIINGYGTVNYGRHDLFNDAIYAKYEPSDSYESVRSAVKSNIGFMLFDVNQDGIDELLIGSDGSDLNEVYTMDQGRVRELIRAGGYGTASSSYTCSLLSNGLFFRHGHGGADRDYYELWQMNGTGEVSFREGYHTDGVLWDSASQKQTGIWYRSGAPMGRVSSPSGSRVQSAAADDWLRTQEWNIYPKKFVPFSVYEHFQEDPWNIAVLSVNGKTSGTAKVNIRKDMDTNSKLVSAKPVGTYVRVLSAENKYYQIAFGNQEGYIQQEYLTPLTYKITQEDEPDPGSDILKKYDLSGVLPVTDPQNMPDEGRDAYPVNGKTANGKVNIREETDKKSRLVATVSKKGTSVTVTGESADRDGVVWYKVEYDGKEGYVRNDFIVLEETGKAGTAGQTELYGLVIKKLATRAGPSPRAEDTGTYSVKGKRLRVYSRAYDPIENAWWVKCDVPYHGEIRTLWAWYTRFDSKTLPLESIPIDENY